MPPAGCGAAPREAKMAILDLKTHNFDDRFPSNPQPNPLKSRHPTPKNRVQNIHTQKSQAVICVPACAALFPCQSCAWLAPQQARRPALRPERMRSTLLELWRARVISREASVQPTKPGTQPHTNTTCPCVPQVVTHSSSSSVDSRRRLRAADRVFFSVVANVSSLLSCSSSMLSTSSRTAPPSVCLG